MPLALPSHVTQAIGRATRTPVLWGRLTLTVLDRVLRRYNDWTTYSGGTGFVSSYQTAVVNEHTEGSNPPARVQMSYPAQPGDPITVVDGFSIRGAETAERYAQQVTGEKGGFAYQTFSLNHGSEPFYTLDSIVLPLSLAESMSARFLVLQLFDPEHLGPNLTGGLLGVSPGVSTATLAVGTDTDATFVITTEFGSSTPPKLVRGKRYGIGLFGETGGRVRWRGSIGAKIRSQEQAGYQIVQALGGLVRTLNPVEGLELDLRVRIKPYRYDGSAPPTHRVRINLGRAPTLPGFFDARYRTPGDSRIRFRLWKSTTGAWGGEEVELGAVDAHTMARDGHDGSVLHVHAGDPIRTADLTQHYQIESNFLGTNGFSAWAATTPKSVRAIVKPGTVNGFLYECTVGGNTGGAEPTWPTIPGATVVDGGVTWKAFRASFLYTPEVHALNVRFADEVFDFCSSQQPILDALPCIGAGMGSIASKLNISGYITEPARITLPLVDLGRYATDKLQRAYLKNLPVELRIGYLGLQTFTTHESLAPFFTGIVDDFTFERDLATLSIRDATTDLDVQIPAPRVTSDTPAVPLDFTDMHLVDALDQIIYSETSRPRQYQERESWAAEREALGPLFVTGRVAAEPTSARTLSRQILEVLGGFLVPDERGRTRLIRYPRGGSPTFAWGDADLLGDPEQGESFTLLANACIVDWNYARNEFAGYVIDVNADSANDLAPGSDIHIAQKRIKGYWIGSDRYNGRVLAQRVAARETKHHSGPLRTWTCPTTHAQLGVQVGDIGTLSTDVALTRYRRGARVVPATVLVISKQVYADRDRIDFEVIDANAFKHPPLPVTPGQYFTLSALAGTAPFSITADATGFWTDPDGGTITEYAWDQDYDGTFQVDAVGINPTFNYGAGTAGRKRIALRVTCTKDGLSASLIVERQVRAKVAPDAKITRLNEPNPGMPLNVRLSGTGSASRSSEIVKYEWDWAYDGSTFVVRATGPELTISMPFRETTVRLRVTDDDGLVGEVSDLLTGKELAPPNVANFRVRQVGEYLQAEWDDIPDADRAGVALQFRAGASATWDQGTAVIDELVPGTTHEWLAPRPYGTYTVLAKWRDTSQNYSAAATAALITTVDPQTRNVVVTQDEKALGWPGTKTNLIHELAGDRWWLDETGRTIQDLPDTGTIQDLPDSLTIQEWGASAASGTYEQPAIDLGAVLNSRVSVAAPTASIPDPDDTSALVEARLATNDSPSPSWGSWSAGNFGDVTARHIQVRVTLATADTASNIALENLQTIVDVPDIRDGARNVVIPIGGTTIAFNKTFHAVPRISSITIQNMTAALYYRITSVTITGFTVAIYRSSDNADVGGTIDWSADGY